MNGVESLTSMGNSDLLSLVEGMDITAHSRSGTWNRRSLIARRHIHATGPREVIFRYHRHDSPRDESFTNAIGTGDELRQLRQLRRV